MGYMSKDAPYHESARTGRRFIYPCLSASIVEFYIDGSFYKALCVTGKGWCSPWEGSLDTLNDTGTIEHADGTLTPVYWRAAGEAQ